MDRKFVLTGAILCAFGLLGLAFTSNKAYAYGLIMFGALFLLSASSNKKENKSNDNKEVSKKTKMSLNDKISIIKKALHNAFHYALRETSEEVFGEELTK